MEPTTRLGINNQQSRAAGASAPPAPGAGRIRPRRLWPGARSLIGGVLIAASLAGLWWAYTLSNATPSTSYIVAVAEIAPGTVVTSDHVGLLAIDLPDGVSAVTFGAGDDATVLGAVAINSLAPGELVTASDIRPIEVGAGADSRYEIAIEIDLPRVLNGDLRPGELVDIFATRGTGTTASTRRIATDVRVLSIAEIGESGLGIGTVAATIAMSSAVDIYEVVAANDQGVLTLVRVPAVRPDEELELVLGLGLGLEGESGNESEADGE